MARGLIHRRPFLGCRRKDICVHRPRIPVALPTLSPFLSGADLTLSWPSINSDFILEQTPTLTGPAPWLPAAYAISDDGTNKSNHASRHQQLAIVPPPPPLIVAISKFSGIPLRFLESMGIFQKPRKRRE